MIYLYYVFSCSHYFPVERRRSFPISALCMPHLSNYPTQFDSEQDLPSQPQTPGAAGYGWLLPYGHFHLGGLGLTGAHLIVLAIHKALFIAPFLLSLFEAAHCHVAPRMPLCATAAACPVPVPTGQASGETLCI